MVRRFRKRNAEVEAVRWFVPGDHPSVVPLGKRWVIATPEGWRPVGAGDWIVTDAAGSSWPMDNGLFVSLYESVGEGDG